MRFCPVHHIVVDIRDGGIAQGSLTATLPKPDEKTTCLRAALGYGCQCQPANITHPLYILFANVPMKDLSASGGNRNWRPLPVDQTQLHVDSGNGRGSPTTHRLRSTSVALTVVPQFIA